MDQIKSALPYGQGKAAGGAAHQVVEVFDEFIVRQQIFGYFEGMPSRYPVAALRTEPRHQWLFRCLDTSRLVLVAYQFSIG